MRIKIVHSICGPAESFRVGQIVDVADARAKELIDARAAEAVTTPTPKAAADPEGEVETASMEGDTEGQHRRSFGQHPSKRR